MSSQYPVLEDKPIDQWKVTELKEELKRRKLPTRGLKEELIRRLEEALCAEDESNGTADNGSEDVQQPEVQLEQEKTGSVTAKAATDVINVSEPDIVLEDKRTEPNVSRDDEAIVDNGSSVVEKENADAPKDIDGSRGIMDEGKVAVGEVVNNADSGSAEDMLVGQVPASETVGLVAENVELVVPLDQQDLEHSETQKESGDFKSQSVTDDSLKVHSEKDLEHSEAQKESGDLNSSLLETDDSSKVHSEKDDSSKTQLEDESSKSPHADDSELRSLHANASINSSGQTNQVSEICPALGFQVLSDSISTESVSINEKNVKDNIIADDVKLEVDVKPETVQLPASPVVPDGGNSHPMDVVEPHQSKPSVEESSGNNTENIDVAKKNDIGDVGSPEKLNLDRSSGDDSMEEDVLDSKQIDSNSNTDEMGIKTKKMEASSVEGEEGLVDIVGDDIPAQAKIDNMEIEKGPAAISTKRKPDDQSGVVNNDVTKRQRRWNSETLKLPGDQNANVVAISTPKDMFQPNLRRSFSRSNSAASEEAPKERVVPPPSKPPTTSLRIDRFLRPFTLKAVQDLLGKTGSVTSFWMDQIKTHCYVSYSTVEEATETRNAVYNLQWPPNGGRQLIAEFVDPQEVKARVEGPPQSPATPISMAPSFAPAQPTAQPQPSPRQQVQRQQLPPPPPSLPPPPLLSHPPTAREPPPQAREHLAPARERLLPPPPPITEKVDPPIVTLDDLFRKTKATPRIYYLPLSDEKVAAKLKCQGKNVIQ